MPAHQTSKTVAFCDLDGTYVLDNSFHVFLSQAWVLGRFTQRVGLGCRVLMRGLGRFSGGHAGLKRRVLRWFAQQESPWRDRVCARVVSKLDHTVSQPIRRQLDALRAQGAHLVLATAAPDIYAAPLARRAGFDSWIATPDIGVPDWHELLGARKSQACLAWLETQDMDATCIVTLTDHPDDLPLLALSDAVVLQTTPSHHGRILDGLAPPRPDIDHIDPVSADEDDEGGENGGYWLWFDDRPEGPINAWEMHTVLSKHRHAALYVGDGHWTRIQPGDPIEAGVQRRDCPLPPSSKRRLLFHLRRRLLRDVLGVFH